MSTDLKYFKSRLFESVSARLPRHKRLGMRSLSDPLGFLKENRHKTDPVMLPWTELMRADFKKDNINQAAYASEILRHNGCRIRKAEKPGKPLVLPVKDMEAIAEMEQGRWVIERLRSGQKFAKQRDTEKKKSPYLTGWRELPEDVRQWDRNTVINWPKLPMNAGIEMDRK